MGSSVVQRDSAALHRGPGLHAVAHRPDRGDQCAGNVYQIVGPGYPGGGVPPSGSSECGGGTLVLPGGGLAPGAPLPPHAEAATKAPPPSTKTWKRRFSFIARAPFRS